MKDIYKILESRGIEIEDKEAFEKEFFANYKTVNEFQRKDEEVKALKEAAKNHETEMSDLRKELDESGLNKEELETIKAKLSEVEEKSKQEKKDYEKKLKDQLYKHKVDEALSSMKFTSDSARDMFAQKLIEKNLPIEDDAFLGLDDFVKSYKETDANAFVSEDKGKPAPKFSSKSNTLDKGKEDEGEGYSRKTPRIM